MTGFRRLAIGILLASFAPAAASRGQTPTPPDVSSSNATWVTNIAQFSALTDQEFLGSCSFQLAGVVTMVDTNRDLTVLQDATGAVALHYHLSEGPLQIGQMVEVNGSNCYPYVVSLPDFPFRPSGADVRSSFEAPTDWAEYYLTRMRGYLTPPTSGQYTFWIASDNSSELWISGDDDPTQIRRIAFIPRYGWVAPRDWNHYPFQHSEAIQMEAGHRYFIEAYQEQTTQDNNLAVAWKGPGINRDVIPGRYLTPSPSQDPGLNLEPATNGVLREYWTNFSAGTLSVITGSRLFQSALSVGQMNVRILGDSPMPQPAALNLNQPLSPKDNYKWVSVEGRVAFAGLENADANLELTNGPVRLRIHAPNLPPGFLHGIGNTVVKVEGVCEGLGIADNATSFGVIWAANPDCLTLEPEKGSADLISYTPPPEAVSNRLQLGGFYSTRGVVTLNDNVLGQDYVFVQEDSSSVTFSLLKRPFYSRVKVGEWVELGGHLHPSMEVSTVDPLTMAEVGWHPLPQASPQPITRPGGQQIDGLWTEVEGIARSVNTNGLIKVMGRGGEIYLWLGQRDSPIPPAWIDGRIHAKGVFSTHVIDGPILLVPSAEYLDVDQQAPRDPFQIPLASASNLRALGTDGSVLHRVRLIGRVTYRDAQSIIIQDQSGGVRLHLSSDVKQSIGDSVEAIGFPGATGEMRDLTDVQLRPSESAAPVEILDLDKNDTLTPHDTGRLVHLTANLISQKAPRGSQVLELQQGQHIYTAVLPNVQGQLLTMAPGSRLVVTGVFESQPETISANSNNSDPSTLAVSSLNLWLRHASDVAVLSGPPWWTWRRAAPFVWALGAILAVALLWVHLLRLRLIRQQESRLAFSRQVLSGQESERRRIAANLHDGLGQDLMVIVNQAQLALQASSTEAALRQRLGEISSLGVQAIEEVRQIALDLRPYHLDRLGLSEAIRSTLTRASETSQTPFASHVDDIDHVFDQEAEIHVYRIVQEAVNNIIKHSGATEATVVIKKGPADVSISIRDNGHGFATEQAASNPNHGFGLDGMTERVRILAGRLDVVSQPEQGTSLNVHIPI